MDDLISRKAAIDAVHRNYDTILDFKSDGRTVADSFEDIINALPSAQPLTAYVISDEDGNIKCSNCGSFECWGNYCMDCGAKMDGVKDDG